jgi:ketosteroid isomerase-like protein
MSAENRAALQALYDRWSAGDWSATDLFDEYAVGVFPDPSPRPIYGLDALGTYWRGFLPDWHDFRIEATRYREADNTIVAWVRRSGKGATSGAAVEDHALHVWTFRGGKVVRMDVYTSEDEALAAAGLAPQADG